MDNKYKKLLDGLKHSENIGWVTGMKLSNYDDITEKKVWKKIFIGICIAAIVLTAVILYILVQK